MMQGVFHLERWLHSLQTPIVIQFSELQILAVKHPEYLPIWMLSPLQRHQLELGMGLSREQHSGRVRDPSPWICSFDGALQESCLHREGVLCKSPWYFYITVQFTTILLEFMTTDFGLSTTSLHKLYKWKHGSEVSRWYSFAPRFPCRWWISENSWIRLRNHTAYTPTSSVQSVATGSNVSVIVVKCRLSFCMIMGHFW